MIREAQPDLLIDQARLKSLLPPGAVSIDRPDPQLLEGLVEGRRVSAANLSRSCRKLEKALEDLCGRAEIHRRRLADSQIGRRRKKAGGYNPPNLPARYQTEPS